MTLPTENAGRNLGPGNLSLGNNTDDNSVCKQILESDPAIRVAAFIEGAEVTSYAEAARTKSAFSQSSDLRKQVGFWSSIVTQMARQTDQMFGNTEYVCFTHKGLKMVSVPLSARKSLGLSLDSSADTDKIVLKIMAKFDFGQNV